MTNTPSQDNAESGVSPASDAGHLSEMFCSIQGEGPFVGERHVFVRTAGCSATCSWCDTVYSKVLTPRFVIHEGADDAPAKKRPLDNPVSIDTAAAEVIAFARRHHPVDAVSITGGEPLEQPGFVVELARRLHADGQRVYLETNGVHPGPLADVIPYLGVIAMDIKLPSAVGVEMWDDHRRFLATIRGTDFEPGRSPVRSPGRDPARSIFVKIVMDAHARLDELATAVAIIAEVSPSIPLILQPESDTLLSPRTPRESAAAMMATIEAGQRAARATLEHVRVMPQFHKILKAR